MQYDHILIRYGELSLKGRNRSKFTNKLHENVRAALKEFPAIKVKKTRHRMFVILNEENPVPIMDKLKHIFGIQSYSLAIRAKSDLDEIKIAALEAFKEAGPETKTFKVTAKRADKNFPIDSQKLNAEVGGYILQHTDGISVDVHHPDVNVKVEVRPGFTYITCFDHKGAGGLPVGSAGKVLLMLSGGIDSPVAAYMLMKRGVQIEAIHFHSPPFTSERSKQKVEDIVNVLTTYGGNISLHIVPFTTIQQLLHKQIPDNYSITSMRRMMLTIAEKVAMKHDILALATGENLGQVASQTLESMNAINEVTSYPVLRPLLTMDKLEIIAIAEEIKTYSISIRPYEDCCTVFLPASPKTRPKKEKVAYYESFLDKDKLIQEVVDAIEIREFPTEAKLEIDDLL